MVRLLCAGEIRSGGRMEDTCDEEVDGSDEKNVLDEKNTFGDAGAFFLGDTFPVAVGKNFKIGLCLGEEEARGVRGDKEGEDCEDGNKSRGGGEVRERGLSV